MTLLGFGLALRIAERLQRPEGVGTDVFDFPRTKRGAMTDVTWLEIERIGERFGVRDKDIPAFITAVAELVGRKPVEDWHGKATSGGNRVGLY